MAIQLNAATRLRAGATPFKAVRADNIMAKCARLLAKNPDKDLQPLADELDEKFMKPFTVFLKTQLGKAFELTQFKPGTGAAVKNDAIVFGLYCRVSGVELTFDFKLTAKELNMDYGLVGFRAKRYTCKTSAFKKGIFTGLIQDLGAALAKANEVGKLKAK